MNKLEAGVLWRKLANDFINKYHNGNFQLKFVAGFNPNKLSQHELHKYIMIYTATMNARGRKITYEDALINLNK